MAVELNFDASIEKLVSKLAKSKAVLEELKEAYSEIEEASKKAISGAAKDQNSFASSTSKTEDSLKSQLGVIEKLEEHLARLEKGQRKATDIKTIKKYNVEIAKTQKTLEQLGNAGVKSLDSVNKTANASKGVFNGLRGTLISTFAPLFAVTAAADGIKEIINLVSEYEQSAADLTAITGAQGQTLEFLKQSAVEVGVETTKSASETLEAYKLIASAKPELLDNAEALASITRRAVTLAEAMGGDLPTASLNLVGIMNQLGAGAEEAERFINGLAAGAKFGSADIESLAASYDVAGVAIKNSNVSFEEGVALLESLAERNLKNAEAGTALRNVLLKLSATDVLPKEATQRLQAAGVDMQKLSDQSLSFTDRLRALQPIQKDANALVSVFGLENQAAASILIETVDNTDRLTEAVTGTNTAYEQAAIRTATVSGEFTRLKNTLSAVIQENGGGLSGLLILLIRLVRNGILFLRDGLDELEEPFKEIFELSGDLFSALQSLFPVLDKNSDSTSGWNKALKVVLVPIKLFFALLKNGIIFLTNIVTGIDNLIKRNKTLSDFFNDLGKEFNEFIDSFILLPAYVSGSLAAIRSFIKDTKNGIAELGTDIKNVFSEAFNFTNLIKNGTGGLEKAVQDLLNNPFEGIGENAVKAFTDEFNKNKETLEVEIASPPINSPSEPSENQTLDTIDNIESSFSRQREEQEKEAEKTRKEAEKLQKEIERAKLNALEEGVDKQLAIENARYRHLIQELEKFNLDTEQATRQHELNKFQIRQNAINDLADLEALTGEERINFLFNQTKAEIDALEAGLAEANGGSLLEEQIKQINLLRENASKEYLASLEDFYGEEISKAQQNEINKLELRQSEFDSQIAFEEFKEREILNIRLKYAERQLKLLEEIKGAESDSALALKATIASIQGEIKKVESLGGSAGEFNIFSLMGLDPNDPQSKKVIDGIQVAGQQTAQVLSEINQTRLNSVNQRIEENNREIEAIGESIEAKQNQLDKEKDLASQGFANNASAVEAEIALLQDQQRREAAERDKAIREKQRIQKQQAIIDTITQSTSLITAAAQIFNSVAAIPFAGVPIAIGLISTMIGSFIAAKAQVFQSIKRQKAKKGAYGIVKGLRHSQGGENLEHHMEAEAGEAFGVLSRTATQKYDKPFEAFVNAANKGDTKGVIDVLKGFVPSNKSKMSEISDNYIILTQNRNDTEGGIDEAKLFNYFEKLIKSNEKPSKSTGYDSEGNRVEKRGSTTRIIRK